MRTITITIDEGRIEVWENGLTTDQLCWDEMLGQIAEMTHPKLLNGRYPMMSKADWEKKWSKPLGAQADENQGEQNVIAGASQAGA